MSWFKRRWRRWRTGGISGQNASENSFKQSAVLLVPILGAWLVIKIWFPENYDQLIVLSIFTWFVWGAVLWAYAKADAGNYIVFAGSKWKFPDGTCRTWDLKIPQDSWEKIVDFPDGTKGYKVYDLGGKFVYDNPDFPYPKVFDSAYWLIWDLWDICFQRRAFGEFFHKGVFVTKPDCEDISVYVVDWEEKDGKEYPICIINDCAFTYQKALETYRNPVVDQRVTPSALNSIYLLYRDARKKADALSSHTAYLEDRLKVAEEEAPDDYREASKSMMKQSRKRHKSIMGTEQPLLTRILNLKTLAIVIFIIAIVFVGGKILGAW